MDARRKYYNRGALTRHFAAALLSLLALAACSGPPQRVWLNAPGWGRAQLVGQSTIPDRAALVLDGQRHLYTFLATEMDGRQRLLVRRLDRDLNVTWERFLDVDVNRPDQPQIAWDGQDLRLFWLDGGRLFTAAFDASGQPLHAPQILSAARAVSSYELVSSQDRIAVWFGGDAQEPGVFAVDLALPEAPLLVDGEGYRPQIRFDANGVLHAAWLRHPPGVAEATLYYTNDADGVAAAAQMQDTAATPVISFRVALTSALQGPTLGVDGSHAYLLWSVLVRTGPAAGAATTSYVSFPLGQPQEAGQPAALYVPAHYDLDYTAVPDDVVLQAGPRVMLDNSGGGVAPLDMWSDTAPQGELALAARASVAYQLRTEAHQAIVVFFHNGQPRHYQLLSFSRANTVAPYVRSDSQGHLYATWMEPGQESRYVAYLASTAPDIQAVLNRVTTEDMGRMTTEALFGLLSGAALAPFTAILWLIAPLFVLGITSFLRRDDERVISPGSVASLLLALVAFWLAKSATLPEMGQVVPFSSWIPIIPQCLAALLRWAVPILTFAVAASVAWRYTYGQRNPSALRFMLLYAAIDSVVSMAIYGSIIYDMI